MSAQHPTWSFDQYQPWLNALRTGQVAAAPAEGVYGYVAHPFDMTALATLQSLKQRNGAKGFIVLIHNVSQLELLCPELPDIYQAAIHHYWQPDQPPITLILPALPDLPDLLTGGKDSVAVRLPHTAYMREYLAAATIPLVSTSLNLSGQPPARQSADIPSAIPSLTLSHPLSGQVSKVYDIQSAVWLR